MEILVALVLIGILVGTLVPSVLGHLGRGELGRLIDDLEAISRGAKSFRVDVTRWPGDLEDLVRRPSTNGDADLNSNGYPPGLIGKWAGPYLEVGTIPGDSLPTALGGVIRNSFTKTTWGDGTFLTVEVTGVTRENVQAVSRIVDGDTIVDHASADNNGRVRWVTTPTEGMRYLIGPVN